MINRWVCAVLLGAIGSCGTPTGSQSTGYSPATSAQKLPQPGKWTLLGYHRYRGWLGQEPITMELIFSPGLFGQGLNCDGTYYYERHGGALEVLGQRVMGSGDADRELVFRPERPLFLSTWYDFPEQWQAVQVAGPLLHGLWTIRFGFVRQYFVMHEDYEDAVRYEVNTAQAYTVCTPYDEATGASYPDTSDITRDYLHMLGPDTLLPALRRLQCPGPAQRQAEMQALAHEEGNECLEMSETIQVLFNGFGLLTVGHYASEVGHLQPHPNNSRQTSTFDLHTGRELLLRDLLDPGTELPLRQAIARQVIQTLGLNSFGLSRDQSGLPIAPLPEGGFGVLSDGLLFGYSDDELVAHAGGTPGILVPWAELLPLLRPNSPLTPLLQAQRRRPQP
jgi:hypothetical protein